VVGDPLQAGNAQFGRAVGRNGHLFASAIDGVVRAVELWANSRQQCEHPLRCSVCQPGS